MLIRLLKDKIIATLSAFLGWFPGSCCSSYFYCTVAGNKRKLPVISAKVDFSNKGNWLIFCLFVFSLCKHNSL